MGMKMTKICYKNEETVKQLKILKRKGREECVVSNCTLFNG